LRAGAQDIPDTVAQAGAAAAQAMSSIDRGAVELEPTAHIDDTKCPGAKCVPLCPFTAITFNKETKVSGERSVCKVRDAWRPARRAAEQHHFTDEQICRNRRAGRLEDVTYVDCRHCAEDVTGTKAGSARCSSRASSHSSATGTCTSDLAGGALT
jgi:Fe-S-cluster-containing hydrogenase component 2